MMGGMTTISISCDDCRMHGTDACDDCVVTFVCNREPDEAVVIDAAEARAIRMLQGAGLVPELRHARRHYAAHNGAYLVSGLRYHDNCVRSCEVSIWCVGGDVWGGRREGLRDHL